MNFVGKIFLFITLLMSVAFMMMAVGVYATHRNWKEEIEKPGSDRGIRAVVKSDGKFARAVGLEDGATKKLRTRMSRTNSSQSPETGEKGRDGDEPRVH